MPFFEVKTFGEGNCIWPVDGKPCGRKFTRFDKRQVVCCAHGDAYEASRAKTRNAAKWRKRKAKKALVK